MVVVDGLTLVEPLADVDVNVPGVMAILVASTAAQVSVLIEPEFTFVGSAVKEVISGMEAFPEVAFGEIVEPQPASPAQTNRVTISELGLFLRNELAESMRNSKQAQFIARAAVAVAASGPSPLDHCRWFVERLLSVIRRSTIEVVPGGGFRHFLLSTGPLMLNQELGRRPPTDS